MVTRDFQDKSTIDEIRSRFDKDVERFSNENTGQTTTVDSQIVLTMIMDIIALEKPKPQRVCDIGCGAGNFSLRISKVFPGLNYTLIDVSMPMLERATERIEEAGGVVDSTIQKDIRDTDLPENNFDIVIAAAVLHHLRDRQEWTDVIQKIYRSLCSNGSFWFWDLIRHENESVEAVQQGLYKAYLTNLKDEEYQKEVFRYIAKEDTPESISFIMKSLINAGFQKVDLLHKNLLFAAIVAKK